VNERERERIYNRVLTEEDKKKRERGPFLKAKA
jgi:hypothetical protein